MNAERKFRILVLGATGQLGSDLIRLLGDHYEVIAGSRQSFPIFDLSKPETLPDKIAASQPDGIINAAAYTAVDQAESEEDVANRINGVAPGVIAECCARLHIPFIHYSTDYVFDGSSSIPYTEGDAVCPLGAYGRSKLQGEIAVKASGCEYSIFRTSWVYGAQGRNFLLTMLRLAKEHKSINVVNDQIGSPTWTGFLADSTLQILNRRLLDSESIEGLFHMTCQGQTSWYDFAVRIFDEAYVLGLISSKPEVRPIATSEYPTPAKRPCYSVLDNSKLATNLKVNSLEWTSALNSCLQTLKKQDQ